MIRRSSPSRVEEALAKAHSVSSIDSPSVLRSSAQTKSQRPLSLSITRSIRTSVLGMQGGSQVEANIPRDSCAVSGGVRRRFQPQF